MFKLRQGVMRGEGRGERGEERKRRGEEDVYGLMLHVELALLNLEECHRCIVWDHCESGGREGRPLPRGSIPSSSSPHADVSLGKTLNPEILPLIV